MKRWIAAALLAAGCYRSTPPPAPPAPARPPVEEPQSSYAHARPRPTAPPAQERGEIADAIAKMSELTDEICACPDKACADAVTQEMARWSTELSRTHPDLKPTEEEMEEVSRVADRMSKCMMTVMGQGSPTPPSP